MKINKTNPLYLVIPIISILGIALLITSISSITETNSEILLKNTVKEVTGNIGSMPSGESIRDKIEDKISKHFPSMSVTDIVLEKVSGLYVLRMPGGYIMYTNQNADFLITNANEQHPQIFSLNGDIPENLTKAINMPINKNLMESFTDGIVFKAENEEVVIRVFSDPGCGYCQKLHGEISEYNALGITVEYAARPIFGEVSEEAFYRLWTLPVEKRAAKMTELKAFFAKRTGSAPDWNAMGLPDATQEAIDIVSKQNQIGISLGFTGTPGIILPNGLTINGYQSAEIINKVLIENGLK